MHSWQKNVFYLEMVSHNIYLFVCLHFSVNETSCLPSMLLVMGKVTVGRPVILQQEER